MCYFALTSEKNMDTASLTIANWNNRNERESRSAHRAFIHGLFLLSTLTCIPVVWACCTKPACLPPALWLAWLTFFAFSLAHASWRLGFRNAVVFVGLALGISLSFEVVGVRSGWPFGSYYYTEKLGWKLFGLVPILVPMAWFIMMYASHTLSAFLLWDSRVEGSPKQLWVHNHVRRAIRHAALAAVVMTAWDLVLDPLMVAHGHWVWLQGGCYFGIPVQNFAGWLGMTFIVCLIYHFCESPSSVTDRQDAEDRIANLPLWSYTAIGAATSLGCAGFGQLVAALVGFLAMAVFLLALLRKRMDQDLAVVGQHGNAMERFHAKPEGGKVGEQSFPFRCGAVLSLERPDPRPQRRQRCRLLVLGRCGSTRPTRPSTPTSSSSSSRIGRASSAPRTRPPAHRVWPSPATQSGSKVHRHRTRSALGFVGQVR